MTTAQPPLRRTLLALTTTAVLALAGCGGSDEPSSPSTSGASSSGSTQGSSKSTAAATVDVKIEGDEVTPVAQAVQIGVGETVRLNITSDRSGELHVHSSPEQELEFEPGTTQLDVTLDKPGSVDIEEHESDALLVRVLVK
jgi:plastocyanin